MPDRTPSAASTEGPPEDAWTGEPDPNEDAVRFALDREAYEDDPWAYMEAQGHDE